MLPEGYLEWVRMLHPFFKKDSPMRPSDRRPEQLRPIVITRGFTRHAEGSVLVEFGETRVLCTASVEAGGPRFLRGSGTGWVTAEAGTLPRSCHVRMRPAGARANPGGRKLEIDG